MDRLTRTIAGCGLALIATTAGCRSTRDEVPPGRGFNRDGRQEPAVGFSTQPHSPQLSASGMPLGGGAPGNNGPGNSPIVRPPGGAGDYSGTVPDRQFGSPGTAGLGQPPPLSANPGDPGAGMGPAPAPYPPQPPARNIGGPVPQPE